MQSKSTSVLSRGGDGSRGRCNPVQYMQSEWPPPCALRRGGTLRGAASHPCGRLQFPGALHLALVNIGRRLRLHMLQRIAPPLGAPVTSVKTRRGPRLHILQRIARPLRSPDDPLWRIHRPCRVQVEVPGPPGGPEGRPQVYVAAPRGKSLLAVEHLGSECLGPAV